MNKQSGFSLVELMITVVIITIVTSIALPSYQQHVKRAHRTDAMTALLLIASEQEKYYIQNNAYTVDLADLGISGTLEGYYDLTVSSTNVQTTFTASAAARSDGPQDSDTKCQTFTLDGSGNRSAGTGTTDNTDYCW